MEIFLPSIESKITGLVLALRFIVFAIMVVGLIVSVGSGRLQGEGLARLLAKAVLIVAALAYQDAWFPKVEEVFIAVANAINPGYSDHPTAASDTIRESTAANPEKKEWSWRQINESIHQAITHALAQIFIYLGTLITVPMLILQYVLRWLLYLLTPFALGILMVPGLSGITVRFFQQLLAIMAWPVGFALTNLVALALWTDFRAAVNPVPTSGSDVAYAPLLTFMGGLIATLMIVIGTISTPLVMQMLFAQGHAFTGQSVNPAHAVEKSAHLFSASTAKNPGSRTPSPAAPQSPPTPPPAVAPRPTI